MNTYFANQSLALTIPLVDAEGVLIDNPGKVTCTVLDEQGQTLVSDQDIAIVAGTGVAEVAIDAEHNLVREGQVRGFRTVQLAVEHDGKTSLLIDEYLIELADSLIVMSNSFQTYAEAMILAAETTGVQELTQAPRSSRMAALVNAHTTLSRLRFRVSDTPQRASQSHLRIRQGGYIDLTAMTAEEFAELPAQFVRAVRTAQIIEAAEALDQFSIHRKRQQGLMSETIGESSMMFRPEKVLNVPVTRRSLDLLRPYLVWELDIGRA